MRPTYLALLSFLAVPVLAFALTIEPGNLYKDVRSSSPEATGINMLTREGIVQGYGNGLFGFSRQINRAEFLKIAMQPYISAGTDAFSGYSWYRNGKVGEMGCFPDVTLAAWFGQYVCEAYDAGFVRGNPDGLFHPERTVNYAEALKMLTLIFGYDIPSLPSGDWPEPYYRAAAEREVDLPITIRFDTPLTRALAARLIAAFLAESKGQLPELRLAEAGQYLPHSSEASSSSENSSSSSLSSSSPSSSLSSSSPTSLFTLPPVSHFLILGKPSDAVAEITLRSAGETSRIASAQVKLFSEVTALDTLELVNAKTGESVAVLRRRTTTDIPDYKLTYEVQIPLDLQPPVPADTDISLALRANIRSVDTNGSSDQLLQLRTFSVTMHGNTSNETKNVPVPAPFPKHQTSFGRITSVKRTTPVSAPIVSGTGILVSAFSISGEVIATKSLAVEHISLSLLRTGKFTVQHWFLRRSDTAQMIPCTMSQDAPVINCPNLGSMGILQGTSPLLLEVRADVFVPSGTTDNTLQVDLDRAGSPEMSGSIEWTDGSGHFKWVEGESPIARGTRWQ